MHEARHAEIGNEDAISSCGGAEWGEHVAFVEDDPLYVLRGANEDKTILPDGSFSAGARALQSKPAPSTPRITAWRTRMTKTPGSAWCTGCAE